jgi:hypothetical protein
MFVLAAADTKLNEQSARKILEDDFGYGLTSFKRVKDKDWTALKKERGVE